MKGRARVDEAFFLLVDGFGETAGVRRFRRQRGRERDWEGELGKEDNVVKESTGE